MVLQLFGDRGKPQAAGPHLLTEYPFTAVRPHTAVLGLISVNCILAGVSKHSV